jgi:hypothetical protein
MSREENMTSWPARTQVAPIAPPTFAGADDADLHFLRSKDREGDKTSDSDRAGND